MKKGTSFYLEEDILKEIEIYKFENGLKSKNTALERIILEYKSMKQELEYTKILADYAKQMMSGGKYITPIISEDAADQEVEDNPNKSKINSKVKKSLKSAYDSMPNE